MKKLSRRGFMKSSAVAGALMAVPTIIPASAMGADAKPPQVIVFKWDVSEWAGWIREYEQFSWF